MTKLPVDEHKLNAEQKEAVYFGDGPLLIIAGAGTGKTTVVTERIKHFISSGKALPSEILALTFTEKAAREMEERVDVIMPYGVTQMWISTFHRFCDRLLRAEAIHIGLNPAYKLMTDTDATMLFRTHLFHFHLDYFRPLGNPTKFIGGILQHFSRLQDEDVSPEQYLTWVESQKAENTDATEESALEIKKYEELAGAYKEYQEVKTREGYMDFGDLITQTLSLFRKRKNILSFYQQQFRYMLVDEFKDTNIAQNELIGLLAGLPAQAGTKQNITAVCDDDQCLPPDTQVETPSGRVAIKDIQPGDVVITSVGKGYLSTSTVAHVRKNAKKARFITFVTDNGATVEATDNHRFFCHIPGKKIGSRYYYVYLMHRRNLGWRLGTTDDLAQRLRLERSADRIVAVHACKSADEARFYEAVYTLRFGIPTYPFKPRKQMVLTEKWLGKLFEEIDSEKGAQRLAEAFGIDLTAHHFALGGVVRGDSERIKVILRMCVRRHRTKWAKERLLIHPSVSHSVSLETSSKKALAELQKANIQLTRAKKGWRLSRRFQDLDEASRFARNVTNVVDGIFEVKFDVAKRNGSARYALVMPAANIFPGMYVPVMKGQGVVYEQVIARSEEVREEMVYDLEIVRTHNFIANRVVVHNSIYKFRGAAVSNVLSFRRHFPQAKLIVLSQNYRSTQAILDASYQLIQHNNPDRLEVKEHINKKLTAKGGTAGIWPKLIYTDRVENEADAVAKEIKRMTETEKTKGKKFEWKDCAILVRANNHAEPFVRALIRHDIPYQFLGPGQLFRQPEIKDLIAYLQVLQNFEDNVALFRIFSMDYFALNARDVAALANFARKQNCSLFEASEVVAGERSIDGVDVPLLGESTIEGITKLVLIIHRHLGLVTKESAGQLLFYFLADTGMMKNILDYSAPIDEKIANNISKFFSKLKTYETDHSDAGVPAVLDWIELSMELGESPLSNDSDWTANDAVNILSVHGAKGLEFPVVFLVNLVSARFPTIERKEKIPIPDSLIKEELPEGDYHLQEERRLCYVGMTRAQDYLFLTGANYYGEGKREKKLSPFVYEVIGETSVISPQMQPKQMSLLDWKPFDSHTLAQGKPAARLAVTYLSYSQIETFRLCPLHYKLRYMFNIPTPSSASLSFGTSIHAALRDFYAMHTAGEEVTKTLLIDLLVRHWQREGYESKRYEGEMKKRGERYLSEYYDKEFHVATKTIALEQSFTVPIGPLKIGGKIDRVDALPSGKIEIIDYKTGRMPSRREVDTNLQLSMYAIAATSIPGAPFGRKPEDIILSLYFFDTQTRISTTRTVEQLKKEKDTIVDIAHQIEISDFRCSGHQLCTTCEYRMFCAARA